MNYGEMFFIGLAVIGDVRPEASVRLLTGVYDKEIAVVFFKKLKGELPKKDEDLVDPEIQTMTERLKEYWRFHLNLMVIGCMKEEERIKRVAKEAEQKARSARIAALSKVHSAGTVKEIAAKLNISLSQVRKLKAEGTLDQALAVLDVIGEEEKD